LAYVSAVLLVAGPVTGPTIIVGDGITGGVDGTIQLITAFAVVEVPVARTVGLKQVSVCVIMLATTFGGKVSSKIISGTAAWQPLLGSITTKVHVPAIPVIVDDCAPNADAGNGIAEGDPGARNAN
jgi:hypothetical protein